MLTDRININEKRGHAVMVSVYTGLFIALADILRILPYELPQASVFWFLLKPLAAKMLLIMVVYWFGWLLLRYGLGWIFKFQPQGLSVAAGVFIAGCYGLYGMLGGLNFGSLDQILSRLIGWSGGVLVVLVLSAASYFVVKSLTESTKKQVLAALCLALPLLLAIILAALWVNKYMFEDLLTQRTLFRAKLFALSSLAINAGFLLAGLATIIIFFLKRRSRLPVRLLYVLAGIVFVSSTWIIVDGLRGAKSHPKSETPPHRIPRVILIVVDTLRADALSCYGSSDVTTGNMDVFARDAVLFEKAYAPAPWTIPSMASIMTGLSPLVHRTTGYKSRLPDALPTLAEQMHDAGYLTWAIGSNLILRRRNFEQGFTGYDFYPKRIDTSLGGKLLAGWFPRHFGNEASTKDLTDISINWLQAHADSDFFLWLHYYDPHEPYEPPDTYLPAADVLPGIGPRFGDKVNVRAGLRVLSAKERQAVKKLYDAEVRYVDENLGRLLRHLKELGIYDDSLIILTSDHGEEFWEHDGYEHGHDLYNEQIWVPLIVKLPGSSAKGRIIQQVSTESITPTLLQLCAVEYDKEKLSCTSLISYWSDQSATTPEIPIVSTGLLFYEEKESAIFDGFKYIRSLVTGNEELYYLPDDPGEKKCLSRLNEDKLTQARQILQERHESAAQRRQFYKIDAEQTQLDRGTMEQLKSLGYVK
jgi:arylsulfatase A-like enzyme